MRVVAAKPIKAPSVRCPRCGANMRLFGVEAHPTLSQVDLRTYVCTQCDGVQTEILPPRL
jgi:C4-type Zn-finger protein